jgi:rRNA maturation endonuclease Nob1
VAKDYATLKAYGHSIDLQVTNLQNNQRQAGATGNNSSSAPRSVPGFRDPNAMDIDANNIGSHFQGLSNKDVVKKWRKWMKDCCHCCGSKLHKNSLEKHPGPPVCNHYGHTGHFSRVCLARL